MNLDKIITHSKPWINKDDHQSVRNILEGGMIAHGEMSKKFERLVSNYINSENVMTCNSGTSALILSLKYLGVGKGDEVVIPTYVCLDVLSAVFFVGATPKISDVNEYGVLDENCISNVFSNKTKAIIAVHIFGHICDIISLKKFNVPIIEDACHAFGLKINNRYAGTLGTFGVFSFHATKCLTTGQGGMLVSNDDNLVKKVSKNFPSNSENHINGFLLSDLQSALGISQLNRYSDFLKKRKTIFKKYDEALQKLKTCRPAYKMNSSFLFRFTIRNKYSFEKLQNKFFSRKIIIKKGVDTLVHNSLNLKDSNFPNALNLFKEVISIPFYPSLSEEEINRVLISIDKILK